MLRPSALRMCFTKVHGTLTSPRRCNSMPVLPTYFSCRWRRSIPFPMHLFSKQMKRSLSTSLVYPQSRSYAVDGTKEHGNSCLGPHVGAHTTDEGGLKHAAGRMNNCVGLHATEERGPRHGTGEEAKDQADKQTVYLEGEGKTKASRAWYSLSTIFGGDAKSAANYKIVDRQLLGVEDGKMEKKQKKRWYLLPKNISRGLAFSLFAYSSIFVLPMSMCMIASGLALLQAPVLLAVVFLPFSFALMGIGVALLMVVPITFLIFLTTIHPPSALLCILLLVAGGHLGYSFTVMSLTIKTPWTSTPSFHDLRIGLPNIFGEMTVSITPSSRTVSTTSVQTDRLAITSTHHQSTHKIWEGANPFK